MHRLYAILSSLNGATRFSSLFSPLCLSSDIIKLSEPYRKFPFLNYNVSIPKYLVLIYLPYLTSMSFILILNNSNR